MTQDQIDKNFEIQLYNRFSSLLGKGMNVALNQQQLERLQDECKELAKMFTQHCRFVAQNTAVTAVERLSNATNDGFIALAEEIDKK